MTKFNTISLTDDMGTDVLMVMKDSICGIAITFADTSDTPWQLRVHFGVHSYNLWFKTKEAAVAEAKKVGAL